MRARTCATVRAGGKLGPLHCQPPLTLRRVGNDDPRICALCLVGSAAGPLAGDELTLELRVEAGARAQLQATGASIAQGRRAVEDDHRDNPPQRATVHWCVDVGEQARLFADPGPLVVCAGSAVDVSIAITLAADAALEWRELVVLGRSTDLGAGSATLRWDVTRAGRPVLRQHVDLSDTSWPGLTAGRRVLASAVLIGPDVAARTIVASSTAAAQRIDAHAVLLTVLGDSAAQVTRDLAALRTQFAA